MLYFLLGLRHTMQCIFGDNDNEVDGKHEEGVTQNLPRKPITNELNSTPIALTEISPRKRQFLILAAFSRRQLAVTCSKILLSKVAMANIRSYELHCLAGKVRDQQRLQLRLQQAMTQTNTPPLAL